MYSIQCYPLRVFEKWVPTFLQTYQWRTDLRCFVAKSTRRQLTFTLGGEEHQHNVGRGKLSFCAFFFVRMTLLKARPGESWAEVTQLQQLLGIPHPTLHISLVNYEPLCLWQSVSRFCDSDSAISSTPLSLLFSPFCAAVIQTRTWNSVKILNTIQMIRFRKGAVNKLFLG